MLRRVFRSRVAAVALGAAVLVGVGGTGAVAAGLISSADIRNGTIRGLDIRDGSVTTTELSDGVVAQLNSVGGSAGSNWGIVDREVFGNGDAYLRTGPTLVMGSGLAVVPPLGEGSLGLRTGSSTDRAAFGNQVAFVNDLVSSLTSLGFSVFTTTENNDRDPHNMPSIVIEIDPNLASAPGAGRASMIYTPANGVADRWTTFDATDNAQGRVWGLTGAAGTATGCEFAGRLCTWDEIQDALADPDGSPATIRSILITKNRGQAFSGAVDALMVRGRVYDFEPLGVNARG
jgi:hypothetical protein